MTGSSSNIGILIVAGVFGLYYLISFGLGAWKAKEIMDKLDTMGSYLYVSGLMGMMSYLISLGLLLIINNQKITAQLDGKLCEENLEYCEDNGTGKRVSHRE